MAFITHLFVNNKLDCFLKKQIFRQPVFKISCLKVLLFSFLFFFTATTSAEGIVARKMDAKITPDGRLAISSRFQTELPETLIDALKQGVPLDFVLEYQLDKPTLASYKNKFNQWVAGNDSVTYRLSYHPLTGQYRVSVGTYSSEYPSFNAATRGLGAIANWQVLEKETLMGVRSQDVRASIRLSLSIGKLPKPFQINAVTSNNWQLDSGWKPLKIGNQ